tara:strand:+ start:91 stop:831 length:741 start_codon:yes stop_codon:yes gene_type:complete
MAINIDRVYTTVLSILNKEQRGFVTPSQFNKVAGQAQLEILDKNFYEYNRFLNRRHNTGYANIPLKIKEKIDVFYKESSNISANSDAYSSGDVYDLPTDVYKIIDVKHNDNSIEQVNQSDFSYLNQSQLTKPSLDFPVYYIYESTGASANFDVAKTRVKVSPVLSNGITVCYIKTPALPNWHFVTTGGQYVFQASAAETQHFQLHPSDESGLIIRILSHCGLTLNDPQVIQAAQNEEMSNIQQENA